MILVSGLVLVRIGGFEVRDPRVRDAGYWLHVLTPLLAIALYVKHRLAGPRIRWEWARRFSVARRRVRRRDGAACTRRTRGRSASRDPRKASSTSIPPKPITANGKFIPAKTLMMDDYCLKCHQDAYEGWFHSAHHFSSFNNKAYLFSVRETRQVALERDGIDPGRPLVRRLPRPGAVLLGRVRRSQLR